MDSYAIDKRFRDQAEANTAMNDPDAYRARREVGLDKERDYQREMHGDFQQNLGAKRELSGTFRQNADLATQLQTSREDATNWRQLQAGEVQQNIAGAGQDATNWRQLQAGEVQKEIAGAGQDATNWRQLQAGEVQKEIAGAGQDAANWRHNTEKAQYHYVPIMGIDPKTGEKVHERTDIYMNGSLMNLPGKEADSHGWMKGMDVKNPTHLNTIAQHFSSLADKPQREKFMASLGQHVPAAIPAFNKMAEDSKTAPTPQISPGGTDITGDTNPAVPGPAAPNPTVPSPAVQAPIPSRFGPAGPRVVGPGPIAPANQSGRFGGSLAPAAPEPVAATPAPVAATPQNISSVNRRNLFGGEQQGSNIGYNYNIDPNQAQNLRRRLG